MISLTNHDFQWGRSEVVIIYPDLWMFPVTRVPQIIQVFKSVHVSIETYGDLGDPPS